MERWTRDVVIAKLKASGVTDAEIADLIAQEAAAHPERELPPPSPPVRYRVRNWSAYNQALIQRASLTLWVDDVTIQGWLGNERPGRVGAPTT